MALAGAVRELYRAGQTDYSLEPVVLVDPLGLPIGRIQDGDAVVFCCRRGEREIQLTEAFVDPEVGSFPRHPFRNLTFVPLTLYHEKFKELPVAFAPSRVGQTLGELVSRAGLRQLRLAESEKFAHVTFFFSGGLNQPFPGQENVRVPSPAGIPFDQVPELSLPQVADRVMAGLDRAYDLIVANFANGDVIGHTANRAAKIRCAEAVDARLGQVLDAALAADYVVLLTADHGNLELMTNADGSPHVSHTANPVPFLVADSRRRPPVAARPGNLADVAPTALQAMGLAQPAAMDGATLFPGHDWGGSRRVLLLILDGWGLGRDDDTNPIYLAPTPVWDGLVRNGSFTRLQAAGDAVGLQPGKAGNSEAGHMNLGAGRVVLQDDVRLDQAMRDGSFYTNETLCRAIDDVRQRDANLHLIGLLSKKSSHGSIDYPLALLRMARQAGLPALGGPGPALGRPGSRVYLHLILDGRSTQPGSAPLLLEELDGQLQEIGLGQIVTAVGRGIALDRDGNYAKTRRAYDALVFGTGLAWPAHAQVS